MIDGVKYDFKDLQFGVPVIKKSRGVAGFSGCPK